MKIKDILFDYFTKHNQDVNDCILYLLSCRYGLKYRSTEETFKFLVDHKFIKLDLNTNKIINLTGLYEGEIVDIPETDMSIETEIKDRIDEYRQLFKGIRPGSIGDKQAVIRAMTQFCIQNGVSFDIVLEAVKQYKDSVDGTRFVLNADNFISKIDKDGNEVSMLKLIIEEQGMEGQSSNWKMI